MPAELTPAQIIRLMIDYAKNADRMPVDRAAAAEAARILVKCHMAPRNATKVWGALRATLATDGIATAKLDEPIIDLAVARRAAFRVADELRSSEPIKRQPPRPATPRKRKNTAADTQAATLPTGDSTVTTTTSEEDTMTMTDIEPTVASLADIDNADLLAELHAGRGQTSDRLTALRAERDRRATELRRAAAGLMHADREPSPLTRERQERRDRIVAAIKAGTPRKDIAEAEGCAVALVGTIAKRQGLSTPRVKHDHDAIVADLAAGMSRVDAAAKYELSPVTIAVLARKAGLKQERTPAKALDPAQLAALRADIAALEATHGVSIGKAALLARKARHADDLDDSEAGDGAAEDDGDRDHDDDADRAAG